MFTRLVMIAAIVLHAVAANAQAPSARAPGGSAPGRQAPTPAPAAAPSAAPPGAQAGPGQPDLAKVESFLHSPGYAVLTKQAIDSIPPDTFKACPSLVSARSQITVMMPLQFGEGATPIGGLWKHSFPVSGCGVDTVLNVYFMARPDGTIGRMVGIPGSTRAGPAAQGNAESVAIGGAKAAVQDNGMVPCPSYIITNTSFQAFGLENPLTPDPGASDQLRPWWENWTVSGCGRAFLVPLDFVPHEGLPIEITQPGHVTQVRLQDPTQDAPNPYALPDPKPSSDVPAGAAPPADAPPPAKP